VAGPVVGGRIAISSSADLWGAELNYRSGFASGYGGRFDLLCGYRYLSLKESLSIRSDLTTLAAAGAAPAGTTIFSADLFDTETQFHGGQVGLAAEWQIGCMTFGLRGTVAAGVSIQRVEIGGASGSVTPAGATVSVPGGLYALPSNIGSYERTRFACASEVGATVGYQVSDNCRLFAGYNCLYWTQVVRAGEQINRQVNGTAIPDPTTGLSAPIGPPAPARRSPRDEYFYAHGLSLGVEFRY
jgi:putative beta barrel porin BBP7